ncbi:MAG TPA: monovalent cation/H+ antiporter subunit D family protein [Vicinamibacteria bacterium]|nr:monovalent cation/H+ antiporter subunit D family protein [Vicinamibacteria bacterium]
MTRHLPILIVVLPLAGAVVVPVAGLLSGRLARGLSLGLLLFTHLFALGALRVALQAGPWRYELGGWAPPWGIEYVIDGLGGGMAVLISFMGLLTGVYAGPSLRQRSGLQAAVFHALHLLLTAGLLGIVVTGDAFNLYVFLEISALAAYALLSGGGDRAAVAAFRYLLVGTIAASFYLLGIGYLYAATGTLNMADLAARLGGSAPPAIVATAVALVVVGLAIKTALFPLHGWLPDAYAYAPTPAVSFISASMSKVGVYVLLRFLFFILPAEGVADRVLDLLSLTAAIAVVAGSVMALAQSDLRRMLAYSSIGQMGYIVMGLGLGNAAALVGALLHVVNHAVMKSCLFMVSGNVQHRAGTWAIAGYAGMGRRLPLTMAAFVVASLSMIGLPPTGGFFSKWYLVLGALERGAWPYVLAIVTSSLLTAVYMFRVIEVAYLRPAKPEDAPRAEAPPAMLAPTLVLALGVVALAVFNQSLVEGVLRPALAGVGR